jgi:thiol-disulfide isomerase/thioredoxin
MAHRHYGKIHRLGKEETEGILEGLCHIQEKVDGANAQIWIEDGIIHTGSRTRDVSNESFNGLTEYARNHQGIIKLLTEYPNYRLYGEWLVRHTIQYNETVYKKFYLFDIYHNETECFLDAMDVFDTAKAYGIEAVPYYGGIENPTMEQLMEFVGKSEFGDRGEGIVVKNYDFMNVFGDFNFAKIVTPSFQEDNGIAFGGNNKHSDTYWEMYIVNKYMTLARIKKVMDKTQPLVDKALDMEHIPRIIGSAYHDMLTEEIWDITKKVPKVDFKALARLAQKKARQVYVDILNGSINVHDSRTWPS